MNLKNLFSIFFMIFFSFVVFAEELKIKNQDNTIEVNDAKN